MALEEKINIFLRENSCYEPQLREIINNMLNSCRYSNNESLERHDFGDEPKKLLNIPDNIDENQIIISLKNNEKIDKSNIELLWGDIQLGKRIHACIIMWISIFILNRPVLYIFRNLNIDKEQLKDDIKGTTNDHFNTQYITNIFRKFPEFGIDENKIKNFRLPQLKDIDKNIDLLTKEGLHPKDIYTCLMNKSQLSKLNTKFNEYVCQNKELVRLTILVDESDLMGPTASNDDNDDKDLNDTTECEKLLAQIYKKVKYVLHITGTAHTLLYNMNTKLNNDTSVLMNISKVHKMQRRENYYGLFSDKIMFNTEKVSKWWKSKDETANSKYEIIKDYNNNIKGIIEIIRARRGYKYNSLLISEEKIKKNHFNLSDKILRDFNDLFLIIYHGNCLRLYLPKKYRDELIQIVITDSKDNSNGKSLYTEGGLKGEAISRENNEELPNDYCYYEIKGLNIKMIYRILRRFFEEATVLITSKTIITITGRYGERGYSFTSDNFDKYSLHLTDQYFISHANFNCTDISQRIRLQGKYNDMELLNGKMKLTLWTTEDLKNVMINFYVPFMKQIEEKIMECNSYEKIIKIIEEIIDNGELNFKSNMRYLDVRKKSKNLSVKNNYKKNINSNLIVGLGDLDDDGKNNFCKTNKLPDYLCVNEIFDIPKSELNDYKHYYCINRREIEYNDSHNEHPSKHYIKEEGDKKYNKKLRKIIKLKNEDVNILTFGDISKNRLKEQKNIDIYLIDKIEKKTYIFTFNYDNWKYMNSKLTSKDLDKLFFINQEKEIFKRSKIKSEFVDNLPDNYYWMTPKGDYYLFSEIKLQQLNVKKPVTT